MKGQLIGEGYTAEIYSWGEKEVVKLFRKDFPEEDVIREYDLCEIIEALGLPVPKVRQLIDLEGRKGIIYQRIIGESLLDKMMKHPFANGKYVRQLAQIHYQIHQYKAEDLASYKDTLVWNISHNEQITTEQKRVILDRLESLPEGGFLCHGDFHPGNIMIENDQTYILDWMTARSGNPCADVARTVLLLKDAALPVNVSGVSKLIFQVMRHRMANEYLKRYLTISGLSKEEIMKWRIPIVAARLQEWIPEAEKKALLKEIEKVN